jgi:hypothetical protein
MLNFYDQSIKQEDSVVISNSEPDGEETSSRKRNEHIHTSDSNNDSKQAPQHVTNFITKNNINNFIITNASHVTAKIEGGTVSIHPSQPPKTKQKQSNFVVSIQE